MSGSKQEALGKLSAAASKRLGIPDDLSFMTPNPFGGMNQQDARTSLEDTEFFWIENFLLTGKSSLRTLYDRGAALYTAPPNRKIVWFAWYNIGSVYYAAVFLDDGTAVQVRQSNGAITTISSTPNTFYIAANGQLPFACQYGAQYLLICNNNTPNDYWIWDGKVLYSAGSITPIASLASGGSGYTSVPGYTVFGGSGSGVVLTPVVVEGAVVRLTIDNPGTGYLPGDIVQVAFSGGGSDTSPILEAVISAGTIQHITLLAGGNGYPTGTFPLGFSGGGGGSGVAGTFTAAGGVVTSIDLTAQGSGYTATPVISFPIPGSGATITATVAANAVNTLIIGAGGSGYTPGTYPLAFSGPGTGAQGTYTVNGSGVVASTLLVFGGTGYTSPPTVSLPAGSGATATALINQGSVTGINIIDGGTGLTGTPSLTIVGGGGTGAAATATISGGAITGTSITNGGSGYQSPPAVEVSAGLNNAAVAFLQLMPFGVSGTSMETFLSRIWISSPDSTSDPQPAGAFLVSAPGSLSDFATSDGGLIFDNTNRFQRTRYVAMHQSNGFLYPISDSSVDVISNVQTSGTPTTTTFNYLNASAQTGAAWRDTVQDFGQAFLFANQNGVQAFYGGTVRRVSGKINDIFVNAFPRDPVTGIVAPLPGAVLPSGAVTNLFTIPVYFMLMTLRDPNTQQQRNMLVGWDEKNWITASQSTDMTFIATQEQDSVMTAWGTDGNVLFPLFTTPSATLTKTLVTKLYGGEREMVERNTRTAYYRATDKSAGQVGVKMTMTIEGEGFNTKLGSYPPVPTSYTAVNPVNPNFAAPNGTLPSWGGEAANVPGTAIGATVTSTSPDFVLSGLSVSYTEIAIGFG